MSWPLGPPACPPTTHHLLCVCVCVCFYETEGQHVNTKAHEATDHPASFLSGREEISQPWFELPTSSLCGAFDNVRKKHLVVTLIPFETLAKGRLTWGPKPQVPLMLASPNMDLGKVPTFEPQEKHLNIFNYLMQKYSWDLCWEMGLDFCLTQLSTQVPSLTSKNCCHVGIHVILGTWDPVWSGKSQLPCSKWLRLHGLTSSDLGLGVHFLIIDSLLQSVHADRVNIDTCNFANCCILPYSISIFKLNGSAWALSLAIQTNKYWYP